MLDEAAAVAGATAIPGKRIAAASTPCICVHAIPMLNPACTSWLSKARLGHLKLAVPAPVTRRSTPQICVSAQRDGS